MNRMARIAGNNWPILVFVALLLTLKAISLGRQRFYNLLANVLKASASFDPGRGVYLFLHLQHCISVQKGQP